MTSKLLLGFGKTTFFWHLINLCQYFQLLNVRLVRERIFGHEETPDGSLSGTPGGRLGGAVVNSFGAAGNYLGAPGGKLRGAPGGKLREPGGRLRGAPGGKRTTFGESRACGTRWRNLN